MANGIDAAEVDLPPPGSRWGRGAHSVLPYLTRSLQAKPAATGAAEQRDRDREAAVAREPRPGPAAH